MKWADMEQRLSIPRQPRLDTPGALHHVMGRGIDGLKIFGGKKDREDFLGRLKDLCDKEALSIYAGVIKDIKTLKRYEWCGHSVMMGIIKRPGGGKSRKIFCQLSVKRLGYCGADVARFLGITTSAVNRLASSTELPEIEKYL